MWIELSRSPLILILSCCILRYVNTLGTPHQKFQLWLPTCNSPHLDLTTRLPMPNLKLCQMNFLYISKDNQRAEWMNVNGPTFCQFFLSSDTRKLMDSCTFWKICFSSIWQLPTATPMQRTFLSWNFTIALVSFTFDSRDSWWDTSVGNFPATNLQEVRIFQS